MQLSEMQEKNTKKFFYFLDNDASISWGKFSMFRREYLPSVVNKQSQDLRSD